MITDKKLFRLLLGRGIKKEGGYTFDDNIPAGIYADLQIDFASLDF